MQVVVDSLLTEYARVGKGKTVVILHGWADSSKGWVAQAEKLGERFDVITVDLPGFGGTQMPDSAWGLNDYAKSVGQFLAKIRAKPFAVIGHSNGGAIAIR